MAVLDQAPADGLMKVLIVAKTRRGSQACVGGITSKGQSVRLIDAEAQWNESAGMEYAVGEVWLVHAAPDPALRPPHIENIVVHSRRRLGSMPDPVPFIERYMPPRVGGVELLYDGLPEALPIGPLFISERTGIPPYSTMFWRPDRDLARDLESKRIRYRYPTSEGGRTLTFVGFQDPLEVIPAGTLLRVSLAHWWRPEGDVEAESRCYVQLSGWFLPRPPATSMQAVDTPGRSSAATSPAIPPGASETQPHSRNTVEVKPSVQPKNSAGAPQLLKSVFGYDQFRPLQGEIVANILNRQDTLVVMPTGSGKSLCFQLPALLLTGLTVVVSPLIALMQDQVDQLRELGVAAAFLNSTLGYMDYVAAMRQVREGQVKLLYTSPETLLRPETLLLLDQAQVECLVIDEAHCISAWGHDFRPEYRRLLDVRKRYPQAVCAAFTATATARVQADIKQVLGFRDENTFIASFDRQNLYLEVWPRSDGLGQTLAFLRSHADQSGIIYCSTRDTVNRLAQSLSGAGFPALPYHAGLDDATRRHNQTLFVRDKAPIIVATIAFGMGINKSNVRFVLHYNLPQSLEHYYQEIGRAGRDGLPADCLLLYNRADSQTQRVLIENGAESERAGRMARLNAMQRYASAQGCRRALLLSYFDDPAAPTACSACDNCRAESTTGAQVDVSEAARKFLACVQFTGQVFGASHIINILRGSQAQKVLARGHDRLALYGTGREHSVDQWRTLAEQFIAQGLLEQDMQHGGLSLTAGGRAVLGGSQVLVRAPRLVPAVDAARPAFDGDLFGRLRDLRRKLAEERNVPPYVIFSDRSLMEMATQYPQLPACFLDIHGVGEHKLAEYGPAFLEVISAFCAEHGIVERPGARPPAHPAAPAQFGTRRWEEVGSQYAGGMSIAEIMAHFGVTRTTVIGNLLQCVQAGQTLDPEPIRQSSGLGAEQQARVLAALEELGTARLAPIYDALERSVPYDELHVMRLYYLCIGS